MNIGIKKKIRNSLNIFILITIFLSCADNVDKSYYYDVAKGNIIIKVIDKDNIPVNKALIEIINRNVKIYTNIDGIAVFELIEKGKWTFKISKLNYSEEREYDILEALTLTKDIHINHSFGDVVQIDSVNPFFIDKYEITNEKYLLFDPELKFKDFETKLPVTEITFFQAQNYCENLGKRLCTKEEFVLVCKTKNNYMYPYGNEYIDSNCNTNYSKLENIGSYINCFSNWNFGRVYDMSGNANEYIYDNGKYYTIGGDFSSNNFFSKCDSYDGQLKDDYKDKKTSFRCCKTIN